MIETPRRFSKLEVWVQAVLRVPPCPEAPEGSPESVQVFHPGRNYYTLCLLVWFFTHFLALAGLNAAHVFISSEFPRMPPWARNAVRITEWVAAFAFVASAAFNSFCAGCLNYYLRWYIITDRSLRIRTGVLNIQELTMTFSNIQEIRVSAGPIQNFLETRGRRSPLCRRRDRRMAADTSGASRVCPTQMPSAISWLKGCGNTAIRG